MIHGGSGVKHSQVVNCEVVVGGEHVIASFPRDMLIRAVPAWVKVGRNAVPRPTNSAISVPGPKQAIILAGMHVPRPQKNIIEHFVSMSIFRCYRAMICCFEHCGL